MVSNILDKRLFINTDISHIEGTGKSIIGMVIRKQRTGQEILYITYSVVKSMSTGDMEFFALYWTLQFLYKEQKAGNLNQELTVTLLCDNKVIVDSINLNKDFKKNNKNIVNGFKYYLDLLNEDNNINFEWIQRNDNKLIDNYIQRQKTKFLSRMNNEYYSLDNNLIKLFDTTLNKLAEITPNIIRTEFLIKRVKESTENILLTFEGNSIDLYMNILNFHIKIINKNVNNVITREYIKFFSDILEITEDHNSAVDSLSFQLAENEL